MSEADANPANTEPAPPRADEPVAHIPVTRTELVWPGKYNPDGTRKEVPRVSLPFQVIETVNESRATRATEKREGKTLFDFYQAKEGATFEAGWKNKLIWGDNLLVMGSLIEKFAGTIDLIYIDPPFATGADFSFRAAIGEEQLDVRKEQSVLEEKAYRDTWGKGTESYLDMLNSRLTLLRDLMSPKASLFVHIDEQLGPYVRVVLDELFGEANFINSITWKRSDAHSDIGQGAKHLGKICDKILYYSKNPEEQVLNMVFNPLPASTVERWYRHVEEATGRRYNKADITGPGGAVKGNPVYEWKGITRAWRFSRKRMEELEHDGRIVYSQSGQPYLKRYLDESKGVPLQDLWDDIKMIRGIHTQSEGLGYSTQKPEALLDRIVKLASNPGDLVADLFCGSGTTLGVAEKLGRRWKPSVCLERAMTSASATRWILWRRQTPAARGSGAAGLSGRARIFRGSRRVMFCCAEKCYEEAKNQTAGSGGIDRGFAAPKTPGRRSWDRGRVARPGCLRGRVL